MLVSNDLLQNRYLVTMPDRTLPMSIPLQRFVAPFIGIIIFLNGHMVIGKDYIFAHVGQKDDQRGLGLSSNISEQRVALVIGNSKYQIAPLLNPVNDAQAIAVTLQGLGFDVIKCENVTANEMKKEIRQFGLRLRKGGVGLFYFAGHGIQVQGRNYLIPIGATLEREQDVQYEAVDADLILSEMRAAENRINILILDACRNNPFTRSFRSAERGLAIMQAPVGTLIAYATAPGAIASDGRGNNSLYTQELLRHIGIPGLKVEDVFKKVRSVVRQKSAGAQIPWESSSMEGDFYFRDLTQEVGGVKGSDSANQDLSLTENLLSGVWSLQGEAITIRRNGKPIFFKFSVGGKVMETTPDNSWSQPRDDMDWHQIGAFLNIYWYDGTSRERVLREFQGTVKRTRIEGTTTETKTGETSTLVFLRVVR